MSLVSNIVINIYSIFILGIIYFQSVKQDDKESLQYRLYIKMLQITIFLLCADIFSRFDGMTYTFYPIVNRIGNFLVFIGNLWLPSVWILYVHDQIFHNERKTSKLIRPFIILNVLNTIFVILSQFFNWFYIIDSKNIYYRGPLFSIAAGTIIGLIIFASMISLINYRKVTRNHLFALAFFAIPPLLGIILQIIFYGISLMLMGVVISLLIVFLNIQNHGMYIDYLTKVNNRKKLDLYLKERINMSTPNKTFSAIMIDLDNFKFINDTYGHDIGDRALQSLVLLLERILKSRDFIARFGGDEFFVVLDVMDKQQLEKIIQRINKAVARQNEFNNEPFKLGLSMGYAVYEYDSHMEMEEFQRKLDLLMYQDKMRKRRTEESL